MYVNTFIVFYCSFSILVYTIILYYHKVSLQHVMKILMFQVKIQLLLVTIFNIHETKYDNAADKIMMAVNIELLNKENSCLLPISSRFVLCTG